MDWWYLQFTCPLYMPAPSEHITERIIFIREFSRSPNATYVGPPEANIWIKDNRQKGHHGGGPLKFS
ncbi:hypothetical protein D915_005691 [Fasciola hepatica]|uniref:Uncharacterized protein n=1 Tax=Fasciola hepatica TaxID=6192 RepID=A0A4E0RRC7_FASHE|nr:hypothetical protein D915_005691 [Fasciola hepatica]